MNLKKILNAMKVAKNLMPAPQTRQPVALRVKTGIKAGWEKKYGVWGG